jgi:hypothetical protein
MISKYKTTREIVNELSHINEGIDLSKSASLIEKTEKLKIRKYLTKKNISRFSNDINECNVLSDDDSNEEIKKAKR